MKKNFSKIIKKTLFIWNEIQKSAVSIHAGQTAFFLMLSFFPFLLFLFSLLQLTPLKEERLLYLLVSVFPSSFRTFIKTIIHDIYTAENASILSLTAISAVWLSSKAFLSLVQGLNSMYQIKETRNYFVLRFFSIIYSIIFAILILLILTLFVFGNSIYHIIQNHFFTINTTLANILHFRSFIGCFILFVLFLIFYHFLPNHSKHSKKFSTNKFRFQIPGAVLSTLGWIILSYIYSYYVENISNYSTFYGTMTTIALLMVWLYLCMYLIFLGAILNHYLASKSHTCIPSK